MVDIVEFVFVFAIVFVQMFLIHFLQVVEIVRAFGIHTFVDDKVFTVFLMHQAVVAMFLEKRLSLVGEKSVWQTLHRT